MAVFAFETFHFWYPELFFVYEIFISDTRSHFSYQKRRISCTL